MEDVRVHEDLTLRVDAERRVVYVLYAPQVLLRRDLALATVRELERLLARMPYVTFVVDAGGIADAEAEYRRIMGEFFRRHRHRTRIALYNLNPWMGAMTSLFAMATRMSIYVAKDAAAAEAWALQPGVAP